MTKLTDEAKKAIGEIRPSLLATASRTGNLPLHVDRKGRAVSGVVQRV